MRMVKYPRMSKRKICCFMMACMLVVSSVFLSACGKKEKTVSQTLFALDTFVTVTIRGQEAQEAFDQASKVLQELEETLSRTKEGSEIDRLNHSSEEAPVALSQGTYTVLQSALSWSEKTGGVFDPTIGPVMDVWGFGSDAKRVPDEEEIQTALEHVSYTKIHLLSDSRAYVDPDTIVDLGGVAKGYIADVLMSTILEYKVSRVILDLGGNVCAFDASKELVIGVISPSDPSLLAAKVNVSSKKKDEAVSVITSGAYERYIEVDGVHYGHIMDTKTGKPVETDLLSATVLTHDGKEGDILSTVLFALGSEKAVELAKKENIACILIGQDGTMWVNEDWKESVHAEAGWTIRYF